MEITFLLTNGKIYTMDGRSFDAVAVSKDRIVKLGSNAEIKTMGGPSTLKIDLKGKSVFPGFNDSHLHLQVQGANRNSADLRTAASIKDIIEMTRRYMIRTDKKSGDWIYGWGWDQNNFMEETFPTRDDLDKISSENPIVLIRTCHHIGAMNSAAIKIVGASNDTFIPGGVLDRDRNGNINGVFRENAIGWVYDRIPGPSVEQIKNDLHAGIEEALSFGVTSLQTSDLHGGIRFDDMIEAYSDLREEGKLKARINAQLYLPDRRLLTEFIKKRFRPFEGDHLFRLGPVKLLLDGHLSYSQEELNGLVSIAHEHGLQLFLHAIGDAAIQAGIDAIEKAVTESPREHRHRINHVQLTNPGLIGRMAALGIMADIQPVFVSSDWSMAESLNPMYGVYAAVTRKGRDGLPKNGWMPEERLSVYEALELYTKGGAYATFEEKEKGTLSEGKLADMVILSEDPFEVEPESIKDIEVLTTILGGEIVFCHGG